MVEFNTTITVGNIIEIVVFAGGGILFLIKQTGAIDNMKEAMKLMQNEIAKIGDILVQNAVIQNRILNAENDIRDLQKGKGYITEEISGEYSRHGKIPHK